MKLRFELRYRTRWGQRFYLSGNLPTAKGHARETPLAMQYLNEELWYAEWEVSMREAFNLEYHYILEDESQGTRLEEWPPHRNFDWKPGMPLQLHFNDVWLDPSEASHALLSRPFDILQPQDYASCAPEVPMKHSRGDFLFQVRAPLLENGRRLCLQLIRTAGGLPETVPMSFRAQDGIWEAKFPALEVPGTFAYQYAFVNQGEHQGGGGEPGEWKTYRSSASQEDWFHVVDDGLVLPEARRFRAAGIAVPVFSLRSREGFGIGEFADIKAMADWAARTGFHLLQLLPVNDTTATYSWKDSYPYAAISAFALHPIYLRLQEMGAVLPGTHPLQQSFETTRKALNALETVDYERVLHFKLQYARALYEKDALGFLNHTQFLEFFEENRAWLVPYAVFCHFRDRFQTPDFTSWGEFSVYRDTWLNGSPSAENPDMRHLGFHYYLQYHLDVQLREAVSYAHSLGVVIKGDLPIGIYRYSADAWTQPQLYHLDMQAGAPPDDFAPKGQNWGFPTYHWEHMAQDGYSWWKLRFSQMSRYFDAFRIDHILGFFRIWQIPLEEREGILGTFHPAIAVSAEELEKRGIPLDEPRYCEPYIHDGIVDEVFGSDAAWVRETFLQAMDTGSYRFRTCCSTQSRIEAALNQLAAEGHQVPGYLRMGLFDLMNDRLLLRRREESGIQYHLRYGLQHTHSFMELPSDLQRKWEALYHDYFYHWQEGLWKQEGMKKLPALKATTRMLMCAEDLGMIPKCVPGVLESLGILSLEIQRMPKQTGREFVNLKQVPYLSVVSPGTHDMSTLRGWWEEDRARSQRFYNQELRFHGSAPYFCESWIVKAILKQHFESGAMWAIIPIQDLLASSEQLRKENPHTERINVPANSQHYWNYRLHLDLAALQSNEAFGGSLTQVLEASGRFRPAKRR